MVSEILQFTPGVVFVLTLMVVIVALVILVVIERRLSRSLLLKRRRDDYFFQQQISVFKDSTREPQERLVFLDGLARQFFHEAFGVRNDLQYAELIEELRRKRKLKSARFCEMMQEGLYAGEIIDAKKVDMLAVYLESLIGEYRTAQKQRNELRERRSLFERLSLDKIEARIQAFFVRPAPQKIRLPLSLRSGTWEHDQGESLEVPQPSEAVKPIDKTRESVPVFMAEPQIKKVFVKPRVRSEPEVYRYVKSLDNLERIKQKIDERRELNTIGQLRTRARLV